MKKPLPETVREICASIQEHFEGDTPSDPEDVLKRIYFDIVGMPRGEAAQMEEVDTA